MISVLSGRGITTTRSVHTLSLPSSPLCTQDTSRQGTTTTAVPPFLSFVFLTSLPTTTSQTERETHRRNGLTPTRRRRAVSTHKEEIHNTGDSFLQPEFLAKKGHPRRKCKALDSDHQFQIDHRPTLRDQSFVAVKKVLKAVAKRPGADPMGSHSRRFFFSDPIYPSKTQHRTIPKKKKREIYIYAAAAARLVRWGSPDRGIATLTDLSKMLVVK